MASANALELPKIDFSESKLKPGTNHWDATKLEVQRALQEYGCFMATFDEVTVDILKGLFDQCEELFDLPSETKERNVATMPFNGYGRYAMLPLYESTGIQDPVIPEKVENFTKLMWPEGNPTFSKTIYSYSEVASRLEKLIRKVVLESFGLEKYQDEHLESTNYYLRVMKYDGPNSTEPHLGTLSHTDKTMMTILCQNSVSGLQLRTKDGEWFDIKPAPGSFIIMAGDALVAWTNDRLYAPFHKVTMSGFDKRYSAAFFSIPKPGYKIKAPEELVDDEHPVAYKPFDHFEYLAFHYGEGFHAEDPLKAYCGV